MYGIVKRVEYMIPAEQEKIITPALCLVAAIKTIPRLYTS